MIRMVNIFLFGVVAFLGLTLAQNTCETGLDCSSSYCYYNRDGFKQCFTNLQYLAEWPEISQKPRCNYNYDCDQITARRSCFASRDESGSRCSTSEEYYLEFPDAHKVDECQENLDCTFEKPNTYQLRYCYRSKNSFKKCFSESNYVREFPEILRKPECSSNNDCDQTDETRTCNKSRDGIFRCSTIAEYYLEYPDERPTVQIIATLPPLGDSN